MMDKEGSLLASMVFEVLLAIATVVFALAEMWGFFAAFAFMSAIVPIWVTAISTAFLMINAPEKEAE